MRLKFLPRSLASKAAVSIFALNIFFLFLNSWVVRAGTKKVVGLNEQMVHIETAPAFVNRLRGSVSLPEQAQAVTEQMRLFEAANPRLASYLVSKDGKILLTRAAPLTIDSISVARIEHSLSRINYDTQATFITDPVSGVEDFSPFVAARITVNGEPGYVVLTLRTYKLWQQMSARIGGVGNAGFWFIAVQMAMLALCVAYMMLRIVVRPIRDVTAALSEFESGNLERRLPVTSEDELSIHARAFNAMADTVAQSLAAIKATDQQRRDLIAGISHDLGAPLTSATGQVHYLLEHLDSGDRADTSRRLSSIGSSLSKIVRLTADLFELAKIDTRGVGLEQEPFSILDTVTEEILPRFSEISEARQVHLRSKHPDVLPLAVGNEHLIERAISNLVENAIRYNRSGGEVLIELAEVGTRIRVSVSDSGLGIAERDLPHIFEQFYRAEEASVKETGGSGLGLAIVQRILESHGSKVFVESTVGNGSKFWFELPAETTR